MLAFPNAKINLGLNVISKRPDGYHNLETVFYPVPLADALEITRLPQDGKHDTELHQWGNYIVEGTDEKNLALRAYRLLQEAGRPTMIFADRFPVRYFVEEYGLDYYAAYPGCAEQAEPSARTVAFLIDKVRQEHTPAVFYIEFSNQKMADVICEDTGCKKLLFHSCHNVTRQQLEEGVSYLGLMRGNLETLKEAFG